MTATEPVDKARRGAPTASLPNLLQRPFQRRPARNPLLGARHRCGGPGRARASVAASCQSRRPTTVGSLPRSDPERRLRPRPDGCPPETARALRARRGHRGRGGRPGPAPWRRRVAPKCLRPDTRGGPAGTRSCWPTATSVSAGPPSRSCAGLRSSSTPGGEWSATWPPLAPGYGCTPVRLVTHRHHSEPFPWAQVGPEAIGPLAVEAGLRVLHLRQRTTAAGSRS